MLAITGLLSLVVIIGVIVAVHWDSMGGSSGVEDDKQPVSNMLTQKNVKNVDVDIRFIRIELTEWL
jgi:hypothetical protein